MKERITHAIIDNHIACNDEMGGASGWQYTTDPDISPVTCKRCLKVLASHKYNVHIFTVVRVKVADVEAKNHAEAMKKAEEHVDFNLLFDCVHGYETEWSEEHSHVLVDEAGDEQYEKSTWYKADLKTQMYKEA